MCPATNDPPNFAVAALALLGVLLAACAAPHVAPAGAAVAPPRIAGDRLVMPDGAALPLRSWRPEGAPHAVVLALHGMNDYSNAFDAAGHRLAAAGIAVYAYDQRGFGAAPNVGVWPGITTLVADLATARALIAERHPGVPVYLMGESMGGAVAMVALAGPDPPPVAGAILVAPAVWGRANMTIFEKAALWLVVHTFPAMRLSAEGLKIVASDNIEMLRALARDPLVLKRTRADAAWGLVNLMDEAHAAASRLPGKALMLYGRKDEIIPKEPSFAVMLALPKDRTRLAYYDNGYHMLLRDLQGPVVIDDLAAWIAEPAAPLPSGADRAADVLMSGARE